MKINNLSKSFETKLFELNFEVKPGEIVMISGPSGSGKTTLLKILTGFLKQDLGNFEISNSIGFLFQEDTSCSWLSVKENILLPFKLRNKKISEYKIDELEKISLNLEITEILNKKVSEISGGQKQRMLLAREILQDKKVYLLDEPLTALEVKLQDKIIQYLIKKFKESNKEVIISTHNDKFKKLGDKIINI